MHNGILGVTVADLLGHEPEPIYGDTARQLIEGRTVLVTGAGGSIGSEIVRQANRLGASRVICLDNSEYTLYELERELTGQPLLTDDTYVLADIQHREELERILKLYRPDIVFHAAACKHLPLLERSPAMAILTNVLGTENVVAACLNTGVKRLVNISTDKAANPTSILGMSKRLAEMITKQHAGNDLRVASVRFGNVFNSRGSFIETLVWQIKRAMPVTITDAAMTRYFMTIPQAASLVIEAGVMANGGHTYVLDMGDSYTIVDLVERYAELIGFNGLQITFTGKRPGEKLDEELFDPRETRRRTAHPAISTVLVDAGTGLSQSELDQLYLAARCGTPATELHKQLATLTTTRPSFVSVEV